MSLLLGSQRHARTAARSAAMVSALALLLSAWLASAESAKGDKKKPWDIEATWGPTREVPLDLRQGTWMSVDVHPSGERIVFDLLGDLYELPITGGEAIKLTDGVAWDFSPRYAPDGRSVAFVSDRGGGDNLWLLPVSTAGGAAPQTKPHALSDESFRLVSSPAFTPDGRFVAGRKHFTSGRSLGAGEIWLYHVDGKTAGVQMNAKPNDQKDLGEPAFSPDGRWLYYSRDATAGDHFEYGKDSNGAIYAIFRVDRRDGRTEQFIAGAGGAIRPTPSPDGRSLAWIRRHRGRTELMLRDLADGTDSVLDDRLDRDLQETWAIHGVYPSIAFTPDSQSLVYWAAGSLWRLDIAFARAGQRDKARSEIAFHVKDRRRVHDALRFAQRAYGDSFDVRMVRHPKRSPDGKTIAFEALGRLWLHDVASGKRRPLAAADAGLQAMPSWSKDSRSVVYISWQDDEAGHIHLADTKGKSRVIIAKPGHYVDPVLSPDGRTVVWRSAVGGGLRTKAHGIDPGIYAAKTQGGGATLVVRDGSAPHFGPEPDRIYLNRQGKADALELWSVGLGDHSERLHARVILGRALLMAPDGRHVAWSENYHAHVAPYAMAAKAITLAAEGKSLPTRRVSRDGADFLAFSGPSSLTWSTGASAFMVDPALDVTPTSVDLGWRERSYVPHGDAAIVGARIVTMVGDEVIEDGTVHWRNGRIVAVGKRSDVALPAKTFVVEGAGRTVIPGLVDVHAHGPQSSDGLLPEQNWAMAATLAFGVTTFHDPSSETTAFFAASERQKAGRLRAPHLFSTGTILYGAKASIFAKIDSRDDALAHLKRLAAAGAFSVKSYNQPRRAQRQQVLSAARELHMMVVPEGGALFQHNMTMIIDGHTGVEHALPQKNVYADVIALWSATQVGHTPTLGVAYGGLGGEHYWYAKTRVDQHPLLSRHVPAFVVDPRARRPHTAPDEEWNHIAAARIARDLLRAGGMVQLGAHGQREGLAAHWELWSFVQGGMTPLEALRVGTIGGARYLGLDGDVGSIEVGKLADLVVIDGNPDVDIRSSDRVAKVVLHGEVIASDTLATLWPPPSTAKSTDQQQGSSAANGVKWWFLQPGGAGPGKTLGAGCGCGLGRH